MAYYIKMKSMKNLLKGAVAIVAVFFSTQFANAQQKIGHINFAEIIQSTPEFKAAEAQLKTLSDVKTKEIQDMVTINQTKQKDASEKLPNRSEGNHETVSSEINKRGEELQDIHTRIQAAQQTAQEEQNKKEDELIAPVH